MLNSIELNCLLEEGRALQIKLSEFIKAPATVPSRRLIARIDKLIKDIKPQLLEPSYAETTELGLLITSLGRIVKTLNAIKATMRPT